MSTSARRIFVSYRRDDCAAHAGWLASTLRASDAGEVFIDVESVGLGENFVLRIEREIEACDVVLVVIGKEWLTLTGVDGSPRLFDELDWVHLEVRSALERGIPVVPVLVEGAVMPRAKELPEQVRDLAYRNGIRLTEASWAADVGRLVDLLPPPSRGAPRSKKSAPVFHGRRSTKPAPSRLPAGTVPEDTVIVAAGSAYPEYLENAAYICQRGRSFRQIEHMGFYAGKEIKPEVAVILHRRDEVLWTRERAEELQTRKDPFDETIAALIERQWDPRSHWRGRRQEGDSYMVFCLTGPSDPKTLVMHQAISHNHSFGWTQKQRYVSFAVLSSSPGTTDEL